MDRNQMDKTPEEELSEAILEQEMPEEDYSDELYQDTPEQDLPIKEKPMKKKKTKKKGTRVFLIVTCSVLALVLLLMVVATVMVYRWLGLINRTDGYVDPMTDEEMQAYLEENTDPFDPNYTGEILNPDDVEWVEDSGLVHSEQVVNILLVGSDSRSSGDRLGGEQSGTDGTALTAVIGVAHHADAGQVQRLHGLIAPVLTSVVGKEDLVVLKGLGHILVQGAGGIGNNAVFVVHGNAKGDFLTHNRILSVVEPRPIQMRRKTWKSKETSVSSSLT